MAAALAAGLTPAEAQPPMTKSPPWFPDTFLFDGNVIHAKQPGHLLIAMNPQASTGKFEIRMGASDDDGRTWRITTPVYNDPTIDFFDPWIDRLPDGTLMIVFHGGHRLTVMRSTDDGATWKIDTLIRGEFVEGQWRRLPPAEPGGPERLALLYTSITSGDDRRSTFWIRTTTDGRHWTEPVAIADGGTLWDATRQGVGPVVDGTLAVVSSYRQSPLDSVAIVHTVLDVRTFQPLTPPHVIAKVAPQLKGTGVFPFIVSCPDGDHVFYSNWQPGPVNSLWEMTIKGDSIVKPPVAFYSRSHMMSGFGGVRIWFPWNGSPFLTWGELPNGPHTFVYSTPRPDLADCAH